MSDFELSDSEEDYNENEKILLRNIKNKKTDAFSDSEDEVFGVGGNEDSDNASDIALSDVEGQDEKDYLPDTRAWGKEKRKFYSTDYVDPDYGGFEGRDAEMAALEEEEAKNLQKQLAQQLDDDDFSLDVFIKNKEPNEKITEEIIKTDTTKLSKRQKLQILKKESPELFSLMDDFQEKIAIARDYLNPVLERYRKGLIISCPAMDFVETQTQLIFNYCTNISMYLLLKSSRMNVQNHPVVKRLYQYRQLLSQLEPIFQDIMKPQLEELLKTTNEEIVMEKRNEKQKKPLKILAKLAKSMKDEKKSEKKKKSVKFMEIEEPEEEVEHAIDPKQTKELENMDSSDDEPKAEENMEEEKSDEVIDATGKRGISYKMAKNKGLTPHRKKEQRNPRVKHRNKFRKAKIRRKGAVREPRTELQRYGGEFSGIKSSVTKSIKIKS